MSELKLADYEWLVGGVADDRRQAIARHMRGDGVSDWLGDFFHSYAAGDPTINKETGRKHTVESMVDELKERVRLDAIEKTASFAPPLRLKLAEVEAGEKTPEQFVEEMSDYVLRHHIRPHHGQSSIPALYEAIKDHFDIEGVEKAGGKDRIISMLEKLREAHTDANPAEALPVYDGTPIQIKKDYEGDRSDFLSQDVKKT